MIVLSATYSRGSLQESVAPLVEADGDDSGDNNDDDHGEDDSGTDTNSN